MKQTFEEFAEAFKVMLVKRYNWSVTKAAEYNTEDLRTEYEKGSSPQEAFSSVFNLKSDLVSGL